MMSDTAKPNGSPPSPAKQQRRSPPRPAKQRQPPKSKGKSAAKGEGDKKIKCPERVMAENFNHPCRVVIVSGTNPPEPAVWHEDRRIWAVGKPALKSAVVKHIHEIERAQQESYSAHYKASVAELVYCEAIDNALVAKGIQFDANMALVGLPRGKVADLRAGEIRNARKSDFVTMETSVAPAPGPTPHFDRFLDQVTSGDSETAAYLWRAMGCTLTSGGSEEVAILLKGEGANGKGTLIGVLMDLLGSYSALLQHDFFKASAERRHQTEMAALHQKRLLANPESADGAWIVQRFKTITGEKHVMANRMRQDPALITLVGTLWAGVNKTPTLDGGRAMERRLRVIPFKLNLKDDEIDPRVKNEWLPSEHPQILYRVLDEAAAYRREGGLLPIPESIATESRDFLEHSGQPLDSWLDDRAVTGEDYEEAAKDLLSDAKQWFEDQGYSWTPNAQKLGRFLKDSGYTPRKSRGARIWLGLRLK